VAHFEQNQIDILAVDEVIDKLPPRQRQIVDEYYFGGFKMAEIAEHLGVSEATVCGDLKHATLWLRDKLGAR
jgi:RNA polymerase sigma factor (sigma-70 family)